MLAASLAALTLGFAPLQTAPQTPPQGATPLPPVDATAAEPQPETRRVCRFETVTGSNRRTRVCRDVPRQGMQDQTTRDFMRDNQRVRTPDI
ncbi:hypothetical protein [Brevundimonas viscosa]|uniref:Uncharacterized protein n=1 Tax=Brevundimonas viscosa TaxID=871741 RepID=A0A1I6NWI1_9CAUL|nr:hypothetical protein [Brevundimonas viscosa]SFS32250.1 hypothetical protein SAMN05192570_0591 [Brevundimonas viscosa]